MIFHKKETEKNWVRGQICEIQSAEDFAASERARKLAELKKTEDLINQAIVSVDHHQNSRLAPSAITEHDYSVPPNPCFQPAPWNFSQCQFPPHPVAGQPFPSGGVTNANFYAELCSLT